MDINELGAEEQQFMEEARHLARHAAWKSLLDQCVKEWQEWRSLSQNARSNDGSKLYRHLRDLTALTFVQNEKDIDDQSLRTLRLIAWQTMASFGSVPPVVQMVIDELGNRGIFPELITLPDWFTGPIQRTP